MVFYVILLSLLGTKPLVMFELIISLLMALGVLTGQKGSKPIIVIDQTTGISYGVGVTNGTGGCITSTSTNTNPNNIPTTFDVYFLVKDSRGNYKLVKR